MKANEAPDKLWWSKGAVWQTNPDSKRYIEYTRTDALIEKTLAYLNEKFYFNNLHYAVENNTFHCMEEMFEDFQNYMKGE